MAKIVAIGGIPASGKTTIIKKFFFKYPKFKTFKWRLISGHFIKELNLFILGRYDGNDTFLGTDKLSMSVQPDYKRFINKYKDVNILFEGDRLFNIKSLDESKLTHNLKVYIIESYDTDKRHKDRNDNQSEKFIKGRYTKIKNIKTYLNNEFTILNNDLYEDIQTNFDTLLSEFDNTLINK